MKIKLVEISKLMACPERLCTHSIISKNTIKTVRDLVAKQHQYATSEVMDDLFDHHDIDIDVSLNASIADLAYGIISQCDYAIKTIFLQQLAKKIETECHPYSGITRIELKYLLGIASKMQFDVKDFLKYHKTPEQDIEEATKSFQKMIINLELAYEQYCQE